MKLPAVALVAAFAAGIAVGAPPFAGSAFPGRGAIGLLFLTGSAILVLGLLLLRKQLLKVATALSLVA